MNAIRGTKEYEPIRGEIIFHIAYCPNCFWIEYGSKAGQSCAKCGATLEYKEVNYWKDFLAELYKLWSVIKNPELNPYFSFKIERDGKNIKYAAL